MSHPQQEAASAPEHLDLGYLAWFVGLRINELVLEALGEAGFGDLRQAHGYVFQHLIAGPLTISELGRQLGVSQQAASKSVAELSTLGYLENVPGADGRSRCVALSSRARAAIVKTRAVRAVLARRLAKRHGAELARARALLGAVLADLGGVHAVRTRTVRAPR